MCHCCLEAVFMRSAVPRSVNGCVMCCVMLCAAFFCRVVLLMQHQQQRPSLRKPHGSGDTTMALNAKSRKQRQRQRTQLQLVKPGRMRRRWLKSRLHVEGYPRSDVYMQACPSIP
jgi:hypothetical protein